MRNSSNNRRSRSRNNNRGKGGNNRGKVYDSNGPEVRIRGTAHQIAEKYEALAKDANAVGDTVLAESYLQYAEHYQRIISELNAKQATHHDGNKNHENKRTHDKNSETSKAEGNKKPADNDDLSLPPSILGDGVKVAAQPVRALEDA